MINVVEGGPVLHLENFRLFFKKNHGDKQLSFKNFWLPEEIRNYKISVVLWSVTCRMDEVHPCLDLLQAIMHRTQFLMNVLVWISWELVRGQSLSNPEVRKFMEFCFTYIFKGSPWQLLMLLVWCGSHSDVQRQALHAASTYCWVTRGHSFADAGASKQCNLLRNDWTVITSVWYKPTNWNLSEHLPVNADTFTEPVSCAHSTARLLIKPFYLRNTIGLSLGHKHLLDICSPKTYTTPWAFPMASI